MTRNTGRTTIRNVAAAAEFGLRCSILRASLLIIASTIVIGGVTVPAASAVTVTTTGDGWNLTLTDRPISDLRIAISSSAARAYWHRNPTCGPPAIYELATGEPSAPSHSSWPPVAYADASLCGIWFNPAFLARADLTGVCHLYVHEDGHLLDHGHTTMLTRAADDPVNVMGDGWMTAMGEPLQCLAFSPIFARAARAELARQARAAAGLPPLPRHRRRGRARHLAPDFRS